MRWAWHASPRITPVRSRAFRCISVTERDWDDVWLSEGFVKSRAQVLALEQQLPDTPIVHRNLADMKKVLSGLMAKRATMVFDAATEPASVTIDPGTWMLGEMGSFAKAR